MLPAEGEKKYLEILKTKSGEEKIRSSLNLTQLVKHLMEDGIRDQFPGIVPQKLKEQASLRNKK